MENKDLEKFGEEILRNVQEAIDSRDYSMLNRTISDTVNGAADYFSHKMRNVGNTVNQNIRGQQGGYRFQGNGAREAWHNEAARGPEAYRSEEADSRRAYRHNGAGGPTAYQSRETGMEKTALFGTTTSSRLGGIFLSVLGCGIGGISLLLLLLLVIGGVALGDFSAGLSVSAVFLGVLTGCFGAIAAAGINKLAMVRRFKMYVRRLGGREYCDVKELQEQTGKNKKYVIHDLEQMIRKGWFKEGHLDKKNTCLMVSHKAYHQYTELMTRIELEEKEKKKQKKAAAEKKPQAQETKDNKNLPPEVQEAIRAGDEYVRKIRECNDAIPGEEISAKISRIELLVDKIFDRVEQNPDSVNDLRRMMEYYLPTTVKLLEAYEELDKQPVQGENIINSKQEIEKTLDTLNVAFEKLLDSLFQDTAWDVSSDISVLNTMLAQEGLTEDGFTKKA